MTRLSFSVPLDIAQKYMDFYIMYYLAFGHSITIETIRPSGINICK